MDDIDTWHERLQSGLPADAPLKRIFVVRETDSTQDAARRMGAAVGDVIIAGRQTMGRGRRGRLWADTASHGLAATFVLHRSTPARHMLASAVATARAAASLVPSSHHVGIKWPNDIVVAGRKLAGVLVEQAASCAYVGIGMNVTQRSWPPELEDIAVSAAQLGASATRLEAAAVLLRCVGEALAQDDKILLAEFARRDALRGKATTFRCGGAIVTGIVRETHPVNGLLIETESGEMRLPAQTTSVLKA